MFDTAEKSFEFLLYNYVEVIINDLETRKINNFAYTDEHDIQKNIPSLKKNS